MRQRLAKWLAPLVALTLLAAACGGRDGEALVGNKNPHEALDAALAALARYEGVRFTLTLESTPEDLAKLDEGDETLDSDVANKILNSTATIVSKGTTLEDAQVEIVANVDGNEAAVELRAVERSLFIRADVRELVETFGGNTSELDAAVAFPPANLKFLGRAIEGEWLGIADIDQVTEQLGLGPVSSQPDTQRVGERLRAILSDYASVTSVGKDDVGNHLLVQLPLRKTVEEFLGALQQFGSFPTPITPLLDTSELPDGDLTLDAWVNDGRLVQLEIDFLKLGVLVGEEPPEDVGRFGLRVQLEQFTSDVEAPPSATMINPQQVFRAFFGAAPTL